MDLGSAGDIFSILMSWLFRIAWGFLDAESKDFSQFNPHWECHEMFF